VSFRGLRRVLQEAGGELGVIRHPHVEKGIHVVVFQNGFFNLLV